MGYWLEIKMKIRIIFSIRMRMRIRSEKDIGYGIWDIGWRLR